MSGVGFARGKAKERDSMMGNGRVETTGCCGGGCVQQRGGWRRSGDQSDVRGSKKEREKRASESLTA
jgi:hypothetical protein